MVAFDFQSTSRFVGLGRTSFGLHSLLTLGSGHKRSSARDKCKHWTIRLASLIFGLGTMTGITVISNFRQPGEKVRSISVSII